MPRQVISNTRDLISLLRIAYSRDRIADMLDATVPTITRWELSKKQGGTLALARYSRAFKKAIDNLADVLEAHGMVIDKVPQLVIVDLAERGGKEPRLFRLVTKTINQYLEKHGESKTSDVMAYVRKETGASVMTIQKAARSIDIQRRNKGFGPGSAWYWSLSVDEGEETE